MSASLRSQLSAIETLGNEVDFLWLDVQAAWYAYYDAVGAYNYAVSPEERIGIREPTKQTPTAIFLCAGSCDALFETASLAQVSHQMYCQEKHGASGTTGVTFYLCSGSCNRSHQHWKECRASACSVLFPPAEHEHTSDYYDHKVRCTESVYSVWNLNAKCGEEYFTCEHSTCPVSNTHWSGSGSGSGGSTPPSGGNPPPSMLACGIHSSGTSGDHSLQASCSSSNANGSCTGTGFYACSHSHDYPSPPSDSGSSDDESCSGNCGYGDACAVTCVHCNAPYNLCTTQRGDCSVMRSDDDWIFGAYHSSE